MKTLRLLAALSLAIATLGHAAEEVAYKPGGKQWAKVWSDFYDNADHEEEIMTPLIKAGPKMVPVIIEAISHKDMRLRRYAIGALGHIKDPLAIAPLTAILEDNSEEDYFRGDAVTAIYQINQKLGTELAKKYAGQGDNLKTVCDAIIKKEPWLLE